MREWMMWGQDNGLMDDVTPVITIHHLRLFTTSHSTNVATIYERDWSHYDGTYILKYKNIHTHKFMGISICKYTYLNNDWKKIWNLELHYVLLWCFLTLLPFIAKWEQKQQKHNRSICGFFWTLTYSSDIKQSGHLAWIKTKFIPHSKHSLVSISTSSRANN